MFHGCPKQFIGLFVLLSITTALPTVLQAQETPPFPKEQGKESKEDPTLLVSVFHLKHTQALHATKIVQQVAFGPAGNKVRIVADERTNSILVQGTKEQVNQIADLLKVVDTALPNGQKPPVNKTNQIKIFNLEHITASETAKVIEELMDGTVRVSAGEVSNSLTVVGTKEQLEIVEAVLLKLDEAPPKNVEVLRIYPLGKNWDDAAQQILIGMREQLNFAVDDKGHRLLVRGNQEAHDTVSELIKAIEVPAKTTANARLQLRLVWLVDSKLASGDAPDPSANLDNLVKVLNDKLGMSNLKMAAQMLVSIDPQEIENRDRNQFQTTGTAKLDGERIGDITTQGTVTDEHGPHPVIHLEINVTERPRQRNQFPPSRGSGNPGLASLVTKVSAPPGHSIVLGVTPIESSNSVFVLQVLPTDAINSAPAARKKPDQSGR